MTVERIFVIFLEKQSDQSSEYKEAVASLAQIIDKDGSLETDGISTFKTCLVTDSGPDPGLDEELCRRIGAQLAELGDCFERENLIKQQLVESLVNEILDNSLTEAQFGSTVQSLLNNVPPGIEQEKASLVIAMLLTRKIGNSIPSLLQTCFATTVNFIQGNFNAYIANLMEQR